MLILASYCNAHPMCDVQALELLRVVVTRIAKSRLQGNRSGLRSFGVGYSPRIGIHKMRMEASSSATSIGTEENSLRVPKA